MAWHSLSAVPPARFPPAARWPTSERLSVCRASRPTGHELTYRVDLLDVQPCFCPLASQEHVEQKVRTIAAIVKFRFRTLQITRRKFGSDLIHSRLKGAGMHLAEPGAFSGLQASRADARREHCPLFPRTAEPGGRPRCVVRRFRPSDQSQQLLAHIAQPN